MSSEKRNEKILERLKKELEETHWCRLEHLKYLRAEIEKYESI
tara:strand:- start:8540 stop:8668 length:129 start_codon:yes stop_codon:yes gene_type:complete